MTALSLQLADAHDELRARIREIRAGLGQGLLREDALLTHCLAFCTALTVHHQGEDDGMFAQLLRERPDLAPAVDKLVADHALISSILGQVRDLAARAAGSGGPALEAIGRELDGLAAIMESHFGYEERAIGRALDALASAPGPDWPAAVFRLSAAD